MSSIKKALHSENPLQNRRRVNRVLDSKRNADNLYIVAQKMIFMIICDGFFYNDSIVLSILK